MSGEMGLQRQRCALPWFSGLGCDGCGGCGSLGVPLYIYIYISGDFNLRSVWFARMLFLMIGLGGRVCGLVPDALGIPPLRKSEGFQQGNQGNPFSII